MLLDRPSCISGGLGRIEFIEISAQCYWDMVRKPYPKTYPTVASSKSNVFLHSLECIRYIEYHSLRQTIFYFISIFTTFHSNDIISLLTQVMVTAGSE